MSEATWISLPFDEALEYFKRKLNVPTLRWTDLWQEMHARGFSVAGAYKADLLQDLREAVERAMADGLPLTEFRKEFDEIVTRHGWAYNGARGWRTRVILETNIQTAYAAGRYRQMTDPAVKRLRPFWEYRHGDSANPREQHLAWDGLILPADDPWWETHYPPNGWGCKCKVFTLSERDMQRMKKDAPDPAPDDGTYTWTHKKTGRTEKVPTGIDPGWAYNPGAADAGYHPDLGKYPPDLRRYVQQEIGDL